MVDHALVIVPTYNESETITEAIRQLFEAVPDNVDLLVVDDGSPDGTADIVKKLAVDEPRVHLLERSAKRGLGDAYRTGFRWALDRGYPAVVEMDADLSHDPADVPRFLAALDDADLVIGSRYVPEGKVENWSSFRESLSRYGNKYAGFWLRFGVKDATSGFRAFRTSALEKIDLDRVASQGYGFQIEMVRRVFLDGGRIVEIPITFVERVAGRSKMSRRIVAEALYGVTRWGIRDRMKGR
ncbi:MAG: polyprenol monophosphomannose synthase [Actinomycetota bacterium]